MSHGTAGLERLALSGKPARVERVTIAHALVTTVQITKS